MKRPSSYLCVLALVLLFPFTLISQSSYNDYSSLDKTFFYKEDFDRPDESWSTNVEGRVKGEITGGGYRYESFNDKAQVRYAYVGSMDWSGDWELEMGITSLGGKPNSSIDMVWDREAGNSNKMHFGFTRGGKYNISEYDGEYKPIVGFTKASFINEITRNRFTVRKVGQTYYFFINERFVKSYSYKPVKGDYVGFMVPPKSAIKVDYIYLRTLKKSSFNDYNSNNSGSNSSSSYASDQYVGIMTQHSGYSQQRWKTRDVFPKEDIAKDWDDGYYISDASYDNGKWTIVTSKGTGFTNQTWKTRKEFPKTEIKEMWDQGYSITEFTYGNGVWAMIMSKSSAYGRQRWATSASFPKEKIKEFWDDGLDITEITYGDGRWAVVGTNTSFITQQRWVTSASYPMGKIRENWGNGYDITQISYHNDRWVVLFSKYTSERVQTIITENDFPKTEIREWWDKGYYITDITYGKKN